MTQIMALNAAICLFIINILNLSFVVLGGWVKFFFMERTTYSTVHSYLHSAREYFNPLLKDSKFKETGVLTPDEFVAAGDYLVYKCPTWQWLAGEPSSMRGCFC
jgi:hypothetical protein